MKMPSWIKKILDLNKYTSKNLFIRIFMIIFTPATAVMTGLALNRYFIIEQRLNYSISENIIWAASQAEVELNLFLSTVVDNMQENSPPARERLIERFDILWSRIHLYQSGTLRQSLSANTALRDQLDELAADLAVIDTIIAGSPTADDLRGIRTRLRPHLAPMRQLTVFALMSDRKERQGIQETQEDVRKELAILVALFLLTIVGFGTHLFASERKAQKNLARLDLSRKEAADAWMRLNQAIEAINEGFVLYDANDRLVLCNTKYRELYARSAGALVPGMRFRDVLIFGIAHGQYRDAEDDPEGWLKTRLDLRQEAPEPFEQELGDGRWLIVSDRRTSDGSLVGIRTDITDLKRSVAELTEARENLRAQAEHMRNLMEAADAANHAKTGFVAMISHEIRTPMNAVLGLASLIKETPLDEKQKRFVSGIEEAGTHLLVLINDILDFARFEAGKTESRPVATEVRELVEGVGKMIGVLATEKGLRYQVCVDSHVPQHLVLDPAYLKQALINLLGNAVKFTDKGEVRLVISWGESKHGPARLRISVSDTGIGIPGSMQERIFEPFERAAGAGAKTKGTGLGLAISRQLIGLMGGKLQLLSSTAAGTEFLIELPVEDAAICDAGMFLADHNIPTADITTNVSPLSILVAEDTPASQLVIQTMLENRGHRVILVGDGAAAVLAAAHDVFDLIILDLQMPVMDGSEAVVAIRNLGGTCKVVPIVALTAQAFEDDRRRILELGFKFYLSKPIQTAELDDVLEKVARQDRTGDRQTQPTIPSPPGESDQLDELEYICGSETFGRLLHCAIANIELEFANLCAADISHDQAALRRSAHRLVGILGQYGSKSAMDAAALVEHASPKDRTANMTRLGQQIEVTLCRLRQREKSLDMVVEVRPTKGFERSWPRQLE